MSGKMNDQEKRRWFSTGYLAHGVGSVAADQHTLNDAAVIQCGEAKGHGMWIDSQFCADVAQAAGANGEKGLKARFGHPDMCSDALGTFLGRWKSLRADADGIVRGSLHLSSTAAESPKGDLRNYVEQMAAKEPDHFGTSIVFSRSWEEEEDFIVANGGQFKFGVYKGMGCFDVKGHAKDRSAIPEGSDYYVDETEWKSPDPANTGNLRHARLSALHAADLVDDPAATDGMFSGAGGAALAASVSEWLDTHPEVLSAFSDNPEMLDIVERYATQLRPFVDRYNSNHPASTAEPVAPEPTPEIPPPAEPDVELTAQIEALTEQLQTVSAERDTLATALTAAEAQVLELLAKVTAADGARLAAEQKLAAFMASGQLPISAEPAEGKITGSLMERARKSKKG
jgi:hypothetical protein